MGPETSIIPAKPAAPPLINSTNQVTFFSLTPENLAANGASPATLT